MRWIAIDPGTNHRRCARAGARIAMAAALAALACGAAPRGPEARPAARVFEDRFERLDAVRQAWIVSAPELAGATVGVEDGAARLTLPAAGELRLRHRLDPASVRGRRLRVSARMRTEAPAETQASLELAITGADVPRVYPARVSSEPLARASSDPAATWRTLTAVIDVAPDSAAVELSLVLRGAGSAWFDDVALEPIAGPARSTITALSAQQVTNVAALIRAVAVIRYRHPSDQAAGLDWDAVLPMAIDRVLRAPDDRALLEELRALLGPIAPTVTLSRAPGEHAALPQGRGVELVRWRHLGLGPDEPYASWREGRGDDLANVRFDVPVGLDRAHCKAAQLRARVRDRSGDGTIVLYAGVDQAGSDDRRFDRAVAAGDEAITLDFELPGDAVAVRAGLELRGRVAVTLEELAWTCDHGAPVAIDLARATWSGDELAALYALEPHLCGAAPCVTIARRPLDTAVVAARDAMDVELAPQLWIHVPLAVWSDGARTLPAVALPTAPPPGAVTDLAERLAIIGTAWAIAATFYPDFRDQQIDWLRELPGALIAATAARSTRETFDALARLIAGMHDAHAHPNHPDFPIDGLLPVALRRFGDQLIVVGALAPYLARVPIGAEVVAIDGVPALQAYAAARERASISTPGWGDVIAPYRLAMGPLGTWSRLRIRTVDGTDREVVLPRLPRALNDSDVREPRPAFGAVLAPGVRYVDLEAMKLERWQAALPDLAQARAIILDMRGYPGGGVWSMIGHFIDHEVRSPRWQTPSLEANGYYTSSWTIRPRLPRLTANVIVLLDGRAASAAETFLQIIHDHHIAVLIGEPSAGTNGNVNVVPLANNFAIRFTGMRVPLADGTALQGHGILPDQLVHPTLEGVRAGRDEVLEAALTRARTLAGD